jgi:hypothetical protein
MFHFRPFYSKKNIYVSFSWEIKWKYMEPLFQPQRSSCQCLWRKPARQWSACMSLVTPSRLREFPMQIIFIITIYFLQSRKKRNLPRIVLILLPAPILGVIDMDESRHIFLCLDTSLYIRQLIWVKWTGRSRSFSTTVLQKIYQALHRIHVGS